MVNAVPFVDRFLQEPFPDDPVTLSCVRVRDAGSFVQRQAP
jgi:hypothetical protein